jgi:hypothetical protein
VVRLAPRSEQTIEYQLSVASSPWVDVRIRVERDSSGDLAVRGVPDCVADPLECVFAVRASHALAIAREAGLPDGVAPWRVDFGWDGKFQTFAWSVCMTHVEGSHGECVSIDANDGRVLGFSGWALRQ